MTPMETAEASGPERARRLGIAFAARPPRLWCPMITHYRDDGSLDAGRITAHLRHLSRYVDGMLIPGSTGDGWELSEDEIRRLLEIIVPLTKTLGLHLLIGVLKTDSADAVATVREIARRLDLRPNDGPSTAGEQRLVGFTICPPKGAGLDQAALERAIEAILDLGQPTAIYQLPQVTLNELSPELVSRLAARRANFLMFKDTSGADRVALSGRDLHGVWLVRGAEGGYAGWLKSEGGPYDGFLLSTANCLAPQLRGIINDSENGQSVRARHQSERISEVVAAVFDAVAGLPQGNPFANANKAMDHFFAHGPGAASVEEPRLHAGVRLPRDIIGKVGGILTAHQLMPARGYLDEGVRE